MTSVYNNNNNICCQNEIKHNKTTMGFHQQPIKLTITTSVG